tara:strand:+ start:4234 stop:4836 length:603 start_codon:yes stop_codon:yes gene_type:complete
MFYLYKGELCVTPVGETIDEYQNAKKAVEKYKDKNLFHDLCLYIFFIHHKEDALGNKNVFYTYPISERKKIVKEKYNLFASITDKKLNEVENLKEVKKFIEFYIRCNYTENERTKETMRQKIDYWRNKYKVINNTPEDDKEYANAMQLAQKLFNEYETKVLLEEKGEEEGMDGFPLYLFEIPESQKPMHIRLKYGDLKNK